LRESAIVRSGFCYILPILALGFLLNGCGGAITHEVCGTVLSTDGPVEINGHAAGSPNSLPDLCAGAIIRTSSGAKIEIACLPNALLHLSENATLEIESITLRKDGNETDDEIEARAARCRLKSGVMDLSHQGTEGVAEFIASTPHGRLIAKFNSVARVAVDDKKTRILCASGTVTFVPTNGGAPVIVEAGFVAECPSTRPTVAAAAGNASDQQALIDLFDRAQRLESLLKSRGASFPRKSD
jgi:hypothetical protein